MMCTSQAERFQRAQRKSSALYAVCSLLAAVLFFAPCDRATAQTMSAPVSVRTGTAQPTVALTLPKALALAAEHNRKLQLAGLAVTDVEEKKSILRSGYYPRIRNESTALHVTELEGVVIPAGAFSQSSATGL